MTRLGRAARLALPLAGLAALAAAGIASAHTLTNSSLRLVLGDSGVTGTVTVSVASLDQALPADERSNVLADDAYAEHVVAYVDAHLTITGAGGEQWPERYTNLTRESTEGIETITIDLIADSGSADPTDFEIDYDAVIEAVAGHEAVLVLETSTGTVSTPGVFSAANHTISIVDHSGVEMADMAGSGFHHVLDGADHLLFLLTLLLPAPFVVAAGRWQRAGVALAARNVLHLVTAFTAGHSLTLAATSLGWVVVPGRLVEVLIAGSVAVSAVHAIHPVVRGGEPLIAGGFGLVHGLAFAGILGELGLSGGTSVLALVAFNVGIELAQMLAVALLFPPIHVLTTGARGDRVRTCGGLVALAAAAGWIVERVGLAANPLAAAEAWVIAHPWVVVVTLGSLAAWVATRRHKADASHPVRVFAPGPGTRYVDARSNNPRCG